MDSDVIIPQCSPSQKNQHQFIVELDALCRALNILEDFILEQTKEKEENKEFSIYQIVVPCFEKCLTRFRDLRFEENSFEFEDELAPDVSLAFENITVLLILLEEKISTCEGGESNSNSKRSEKIKDFFGIKTNAKQNSTDGNSTGSSNWTQKILEGIMMGKKMQTRFDFIGKRGLSKETIAGIRDMNLGKIKAGKHVGKNVLRFDLGRKTGQSHINIDPRGFPSKKNPHIDVPASVVKAAPYVQKGVKYLGNALTFASIAADSYRMYCAGKADYDKKAQDVVDIERLMKETALIRTFLVKKEHLLKEDDLLKNYVLLKEKDLLKKKHSLKDYVLLEKYVLLKEDGSQNEDNSQNEYDSLKEYVLLKKENLLKKEDLLKDSIKKYVLLKKPVLKLKEEDLFVDLELLKEKDLFKDYVLLKKEDLSKEYFLLIKMEDLSKEDLPNEDLPNEDLPNEDLQLESLTKECDSLIEDLPIIKSLKDAIKEYRLTIQMIKNGQNVPVKSIKTGSSIAGGLVGGTVGGSIGATVGAAASGAAAGLVFGPPGVMVGSIVGAISGAIGLGIGGGMAGSAASEKLAEKTLDKVLGPITMDTQKEDGEEESK